MKSSLLDDLLENLAQPNPQNLIINVRNLVELNSYIDSNRNRRFEIAIHRGIEGDFFLHIKDENNPNGTPYIVKVIIEQ